MSKETFSQTITGENFLWKVSQENLSKILTSLEMSAVLRYLKLLKPEAVKSFWINLNFFLSWTLNSVSEFSFNAEIIFSDEMWILC